MSGDALIDYLNKWRRLAKWSATSAGVLLGLVITLVVALGAVHVRLIPLGLNAPIYALLCVWLAVSTMTTVYLNLEYLKELRRQSASLQVSGGEVAPGRGGLQAVSLPR